MSGRLPGLGSPDLRSPLSDLPWRHGAGRFADRESLRRFLSVPRAEIRDSIMPVGVDEPAELERLLDYLESLR